MRRHTNYSLLYVSFAVSKKTPTEMVWMMVTAVTGAKAHRYHIVAVVVVAVDDAVDAEINYYHYKYY